MRFAIPFLLSAACCTSAIASPRPPKTPVRVKSRPALPLDFDGQRAAMNATRIDTLDELRDSKGALAGKVVEMRGEIKGLFGGSGAQTVLLQLPDGQTQILSAAPDSGFSSSPCAHVGNWMRALCRVATSAGTDVNLDILRVTDQPERKALSSPGDDASPILLSKNVPGAPPPDEVMRAPDSDLSVVPSTSLPSAGSVTPSDSASPTNTSPRQVAARPPRANALFGFDDLSRAGFRALAQRSNPRLSDEAADSIAVSLLEAAQSQGLDPRFLAAIVQVESRFDPYSVSSAGALGLGQLMPFNLRPLGVSDGFDVRQNLLGSARLLRQNLNIYAHDRNGTMLAVAAYHAGVGAVNRAGRAIPKATTQRYVWKVYYAYRALAPELFR